MEFVIKSYWLMLLPFSIGVFFIRKMRPKEKYFLYLLIGSMLVAILQGQTSAENNLFTLYIYGAIEVLFVSMALFSFKESKKKDLIFIIILGFLLLSGSIEGILISSGFQKFNSYSQVPIPLLQIGLEIYVLMSLRKNELISNLSKAPIF